MHLEKRAFQKRYLFDIKEKKVIGLGGPNIKSWEKLFPASVEKILSCEKDPIVFKEQVDQFDGKIPKRLTLLNRDIIDMPSNDSYFYDLDFCGTIKSAAETVNYYKDRKFMLTLCERVANQEKILFEDCLEEKIVSISAIGVEIGGHKLLKIITDKSIFVEYHYKDVSPMVVYYKISKLNTIIHEDHRLLQQ